MWNGLMRSDGVHITTLDTENSWVICEPSGQIAMSKCPCCSLSIRTEQAAKRVADVYLPLLPEAA